MARTFRIRIKFQQLRDNMSREEGRTLSDDEVRQWLMDARFQLVEDGIWRVSEADLGQISPAEVESIEEDPG